MPDVRAAIIVAQRHFAETPPAGKAGAVLDGRDIGTVICPDAPAKLFVTASAEARAKRRYDELIERGQDASLDQVLAEVKERDERDMNRADAPLRPADDATHLDTTELSIDEAVAKAIELIDAKRG